MRIFPLNRPDMRAFGGGDSCCGQVEPRVARRETVRAVRVSRSWARPFLARLFIPASDYYGNVAGLNERGYRVMPRVEQTLASYLSPRVASSLKALALPTKPTPHYIRAVSKGYAAAGQAGACLHTMAVLQAYQADC